MGNGPAFLLFARDFYAGTSDLTAEEVGIYLRGLLWSWDNGPLPLDEGRRARACLCTLKQLRRCWPAISQSWLTGIDGYSNQRLEKTRAEQIEYRSKQAKHGQKGAIARWGSPSTPDGVAHSNEDGVSMALQILNHSPIQKDQDLQRGGGPSQIVNGSSHAHTQNARATEKTPTIASQNLPKWTHGQTRSRPGLVGSHVRCFHAPAACARGACVPGFLGQQWTQQLAETADPLDYIAGIVAQAIQELPAGPLGDDPITYWRAVWSAKHGSQAPAKAAAAKPSSATAMQKARETFMAERTAKEKAV